MFNLHLLRALCAVLLSQCLCGGAVQVAFDLDQALHPPESNVLVIATPTPIPTLLPTVQPPQGSTGTDAIGCTPLPSAACTATAAAPAWDAWEPTLPEATENVSAEPSIDDLVDASAALYGFGEKWDDPYYPTYLNYVGFSHYIARDAGIVDGLEYVLMGGISPTQFADYLAYLIRFGYDIALDATQADIRFVELRDLDAPPYLPVTFRCYYNSALESLVTADAASTVDHSASLPATEAVNGIGVPMSVGDGVTVTLLNISQIQGFAVTDTQTPVYSRASQALLANDVDFPLPQLTVDNDLPVTVIEPSASSASNNGTHFMLLELSVDSKSAPIALSDLDFVVYDDDITTSPTAVASGIRSVNNRVVLLTQPIEPVSGTQLVWLAVPVYEWDLQKPLRLCVSKAAGRLPLWDRPAVWFMLDAFAQP